MSNPFASEERDAFRDAVVRFVDTEIRPSADEWDEAGEFPWELHAKIAELGVFGFGIDEAYGGLGFDDCFMRAAYAEELGRCGAGGVFAGLNTRMISTGPIAALASEEIKQRVLPDVLAGAKLASLAITEPSAGSDVANIRTTARRDGDDYVLDGTKTFISGGTKSDFFVVGARTGGEGLLGISLFLVERGTAGFSDVPLERKMGWWCSDQATLFFDNARVPASNMIGEEHRGFVAIMRNFNHERLAMIAASLGMMKECLDYSIQWARQRETFGKQAQAGGNVGAYRRGGGMAQPDMLARQRRRHAGRANLQSQVLHDQGARILCE